ncbi:DNA-3-methyladenine glycosylase family protein [Gulosibacter molinativorax]|uniref:DNA-3-methyladenine glycosylase II n=1 Tax=Gulosibacter molinativorax TaxID=256821 RepID=A0ABT7C9M4_9MICO|nr:DNA-3-methyladenine glycosylase [Gulosibacter molinativorax]MDJ1371860.1 DNA-3-methyladenine glycosylase 2 family protein [Gulosibacter molinativorax]QUY62509.1 DNA-3-methyladenine glycosylase [Gulosibacter molinativorax]
MSDFTERTWTPPHPTNLGSTLSALQHGPGDPTFQWLTPGQDALLARRFDGQLATLRLTQLPDGVLRARAWGDGASAALDRAPEICGAADDSSTFMPLLPAIEDAHRRRDGMRIPRTGDVFAELVPVILEQKVLVEQATASYRRLVLRFGEPAPGLPPHLAARMRVAPDAGTWRRIPSWVWHRAGVDPSRSRTVVQLAARASSIDRLARLPAADARARLETLPGVGPWSSAEVAQRALGDADAVSVGDYHLRKHIGHALEGRDYTDAEMVAALEPWRGQRFRAVRLILAAGPRRPRRGPRMGKVDYRAF